MPPKSTQPSPPTIDELHQTLHERLKQLHYSTLHGKGCEVLGALRQQLLASAKGLNMAALRNYPLLNDRNFIETGLTGIYVRTGMTDRDDDSPVRARGILESFVRLTHLVAPDAIDTHSLQRRYAELLLYSQCSELRRYLVLEGTRAWGQIAHFPVGFECLLTAAIQRGDRELFKLVRPDDPKRLYDLLRNTKFGDNTESPIMLAIGEWPLLHKYLSLFPYNHFVADKALFVAAISSPNALQVLADRTTPEKLRSIVDAKLLNQAIEYPRSLQILCDAFNLGDVRQSTQLCRLFDGCDDKGVRLYDKLEDCPELLQRLSGPMGNYHRQFKRSSKASVAGSDDNSAHQQARKQLLQRAMIDAQKLWDKFSWPATDPKEKPRLQGMLCKLADNSSFPEVRQYLAAKLNPELSVQGEAVVMQPSDATGAMQASSRQWAGVGANGAVAHVSTAASSRGCKLPQLASAALVKPDVASSAQPQQSQPAKPAQDETFPEIQRARSVRFADIPAAAAASSVIGTTGAERSRRGLGGVSSSGGSSASACSFGSFSFSDVGSHDARSSILSASQRSGLAATARRKPAVTTGLRRGASSSFSLMSPSNSGSGDGDNSFSLSFSSPSPKFRRK